MKKYYGKNDAWFLIVFIFYNVFPIILITLNAKTLLSHFWWIFFWIIYYSFNLFWIPIAVRNRIELFEDYFIFYYGFCKEKIFLKDIIDIHKSRNPIASSANSLDRIHVITKKKDFYVAMKNNDDFIREVLKYKEKR